MYMYRERERQRCIMSKMTITMMIQYDVVLY